MADSHEALSESLVIHDLIADQGSAGAGAENVIPGRDNVFCIHVPLGRGHALTAMAQAKKANGKGRRGGVTGKGFLPGQVINPGGRPREVADLRALARRPTELIINNLIHVVEHGRWPNERSKVSDPVRMVAHLTLLDRGYGKPLSTAVVADLTPLPDPKTITPQMSMQEAQQLYADSLKQGERELLEGPVIDVDVEPNKEGES
jgi:hypothetical protein